MGRFISVVGLQHLPKNSGFSIDKIAQQLCQHVIGMNPQSLGTEESTESETVDSTESKDEEANVDEDKQKEEDEDLNNFSDVKVGFKIYF